MRRALLALVAVAVIAVTMMVVVPAAHADPPPVPGLQCSQFVVSIGCNAEPSAPVKAVTQVVDFVKDPLGYLAAAIMGAATWMLGQVSALANASTAPDLTASWWIDAYQKGMAVGIVLFCFVLLYETFALVRRKITPDDYMATLGLYAPATLGAMLFGPAVFQFLIQGATDLADGIIHSMTGFGGGDAFKAVTDAAADTGFGGGVTGAVQAFLSVFFGLAMLITAVLVYLSLCMQAIVIYLGTAIFAVGVVWYASTKHRDHAWSIPRMIVTVAFSKCVLFFCLGICLAMATAATSIQGDGVSRDLALMVMATIGMLIAAFTPLILLKHAPILPGMGAGIGVGAGIAGSAVGWTAGSAAARAAGRGVRAGGSKLGAVTSRKGAATPPPGSSGGAGGGNRTIDPPLPVPASGTSKAGKRAAGSGGNDPGGSASGGGGGVSGRGGSGSAARSASAAQRTRKDRAAARGGGRVDPNPPSGARGQKPSSNGSASAEPDLPWLPRTPRLPESTGSSKLNQSTRKPSPPPPTGDAT